ncbi:PAP_fibrillin [Seminavis robusta]|uniref:PAP_fibrillin n=1 Tax=Seminavis robusta TaxID=568900 RepID=A0A9N8ETI6_9STRA|nr:PAP_fibrillin [Seminavis robusta]|eukprot:Sro1722_g293590.1 PAP_fibrillin (311) ;mRNA; r:15809-16741
MPEPTATQLPFEPMANHFVSTSEITVDGIETKLQAAKNKLKAALQQHHGSTKNPDVMAAVDELVAMNPTKNAVASPLLLGEFIAHTSPDFPGRIKPAAGQETVVQYTMGRLSFGIFQPHHLVCTIRSVRNSILECEEEDLQVDGQKTFVYPIQIDLTIHTPKGDLPATMCHSALCYVLPDHENRLGVTFRGGSLTPTYEVRSDPKRMAVWEEVFDSAYSKAEQERSLMASVLQYIFKAVFQLSTPTDEDAKNDKQHAVKFDMKRSPRGYLDVLYLDEDIRVTRGNRGTIIVVERVPSSTKRVFRQAPALN